MKIYERILQELESKTELSVKELVEMLDVSKQAIHVSLDKLLEQDLVEKIGKAPKTIYRLKNSSKGRTELKSLLNADELAFLESHFILLTSVGTLLQGSPAFSEWCKQRSLPFEKTVREYIETTKKYLLYVNSMGFIDGMPKLRSTKGYDTIFLDDLYYLDFYAIERFGKTQLGTLLHYAKQGQHKGLMKMVVEKAKPKLETLVQAYGFDAVAYVPPTIRREVQFMKYLETHLKLNLPRVKIQKISGIIPVPQKSLSKLNERIENAETTFAVSETNQYRHLLLIDDALGSGSTLNQIAGKLKRKAIAQKVTGVAIVGSFKGFDVITDV